MRTCVEGREEEGVAARRDGVLWSGCGMGRGGRSQAMTDDAIYPCFDTLHGSCNARSGDVRAQSEWLYVQLIKWFSSVTRTWVVPSDAMNEV